MNLLDGQYEFSIHQTNLQGLKTEMHEEVNEIYPPVMNSLFEYKLVLLEKISRKLL